MGINTNYSSTTGSNVASFSTVIKHRNVTAETSKPFVPAPELKEQADVEGKQQDKKEDTVISDAEKQYFEGLFPSAADEIRSYSPYQRNGARQSAGLGTLVDVKG